MTPTLAIKSSVGQGGKNLRHEVKLVQMLLNTWLPTVGKDLLKPDGIVGPLTIGAIKAFQTAAKLKVVDGRIDPNGPTIHTLGYMVSSYVAAKLHPRAAMYTQLAAMRQTEPSSTPATKLVWYALATKHTGGQA